MREEIPILVFECGRWQFGVDVDQVEALVGLPEAPAAAEHVACEYEGQAWPVHVLSAWLGIDDPTWQPSRVLMVRGREYASGGDDALRAFLVDTPRDIVRLPLEAVYRLPELVRRVLGTTPFWGVGHNRQNDELILLVDLGADVVRDAGVAREARVEPGAGPGGKGES